uniref:Uncharacterized protein n=1 Tax=Timema bartmani TaxID=61472 RepID=A0A7R9EW68_9NEOP|nr:unnamed protein product [Timema bartmani]
MATVINRKYTHICMKGEWKTILEKPPSVHLTEIRTASSSSSDLSAARVARLEEATGNIDEPVLQNLSNIGVALLEGAVFAQHVQGLQLLHHKLSVGEEEFYLVRLHHISVLGERPFETSAEIIVTLRVLPAQVQQLEAQSASILTGSGLDQDNTVGLLRTDQNKLFASSSIAIREQSTSSMSTSHVSNNEVMLAVQFISSSQNVNVIK